MASQTESDLDQLLSDLNKLKNFELRQFRYNEKALQLQWALGEDFVWLTFSMKPGTAYVFYSRKRVPLVRNLKKPLPLFLKTHFVGEKVESIVRLQELGRVLSIKFSGEGESKEVRLILIPGRVNIELHVGPKSVYALKPKEIPEKQENGQARLGHENEFFAKRWAQQNQTQGKPQEKSLEKDKAKKQKGLAKMLETLQKLKEDLWQKAGDWLKQNQSFESLPTELEQKVDLSQTLAWNIQNCFSQSKKNQAKIKGTEERILKLKNELASLENGETTERRIEKKPTSLLHQAKLKGKTKTLREGRLFIGKSGPENLKLLRKAKPWYYWIHIKDYPGSYGIIERNKNQKISPESLEQASLAVVRQSLPRGAEGLFQVLYAECRYVRPIKGAKSGQVTYSHEKVLTVKVTP